MATKCKQVESRMKSKGKPADQDRWKINWVHWFENPG